MFEYRIFGPNDDLTDAFFVRREVFTLEQGFADPDSDQFDKISTHLVVYHEDKPVATGRVYCEQDGITFHIGRLCVLKSYRGYHLGMELIRRLEQTARDQGAKLLVIGAQLYAVGFYQKSGYVPTGERYMDEFCEHEILHKRL